MTRAALVLAAVLMVAGCGSTRVVTKTDPRPRIHDNTSSITQVRANFAGEPSQRKDVGGGITCEWYGTPQKVINAGGPAWTVQLCYRLPKE